MTTLKLAIATEAAYAPPNVPWADDDGLAQGLRTRGHHVSIIDWQNADVVIEDYDAVFVSTTWNIPDDPLAFLQWLEACERDGVRRLINARAVLRDGVIKPLYLSYLIERFGERRSLAGSVIPTRFFAARGDLVSFAVSAADMDFTHILSDAGPVAAWGDVDFVIKPAISADGRDTFLYHRTGRGEDAYAADLEEAVAAFRRIAAAPAGVMLQPYMPEIERGEYSLVYFAGDYSHAILKPPGFRNDDSQERRAVPRDELPEGMETFARKIVLALGEKYGLPSLTRVRVDLFWSEEGAVLCECECVEPNLNLRSFAPRTRDGLLMRLIEAIETQAQRLTAAR